MSSPSIFAIGDLHLSFSSEKPMGVFGAGWEDHFERIENHWRRLVAEDDVVLVLGDLSWALKYEEAAADLAWIQALPGRKVIFKGNHDLWWSAIGRLRQDYPAMTFIQNDACRFGDVAFCGSRGWLCPGDSGYGAADEKIYLRELIRLRMSLEAGRRTGAARLIAGLHYPPTAGNRLGSGFTDLFREFGVLTAVYGHLHGREAFRKALTGPFEGTKYVLASADYVDFSPVKIGEITEEV
jgi:predicted phosphohydrolase